MHASHSVCAVLFLITAAACSDSTPNAPSDSPGAGDTSSSITRVHDGHWQGVTADGFFLALTITEDHVRSFVFELPEVQGSSCVFGRGGFEISGSNNFDLAGKGDPAIIGDRFTLVSRAPMSVDGGNASSIDVSLNFTLSGTLTSTAGEVTGDFVFSASSCSGRSSARWSVTRTS